MLSTIGARWEYLTLAFWLALPGVRCSWSEFVESTVKRVHDSVPPLDAGYGVEPEQCATSPAVVRLAMFTHFAVSDWLTAAPSSVPDVGRQAAFHGSESSGVVDEALKAADIGYYMQCGCWVAQLALDLLTTVIRALPLGPGFPGNPDFIGPGSPAVSWYETVHSRWPIFGLASQALRVEAQLTGLYVISVGTEKCGAFLESVPVLPLDVDALVLSAVRFLDMPMSDGPRCHLAAALAVSVLIQEAPKHVQFMATRTVASLLTLAGRGEPAPRAAIFFLLDRALSCPSQVEVRSSAGRRFAMHVFPFRDHISDQIRFFRDNHCGVQSRTGVGLERELASLLAVAERGQLLVADIGAGFGQCLLPLLLEPRVEAIAVEASRRLRQLMAKSFEANGVSSRVKIVPAFVTLNDSERGLVDLVHDAGHFTVGGRDALMERGSAALPPIHEQSSAYYTSLPALLGSSRVDLLLISQRVLCRGMEAASGPPVRCGRRLDTPDPSGEMCAFLDCKAAG